MANKISIGMPLYNAERYLENALDSVLDQTFRDFELIISDNASTDRTQEICREYAKRDGRIRYHRNSENIGGGRNFSRVFELSSGEYFKWHSYDDLLAPEFLERCIEVLERDASLALVTSANRLMDQNGNVLDIDERMVDFIAGHYVTIKGQRDPYSANPTDRFRAVVMRRFWHWNQEIHGLIRSSVLAQTPLHGPFDGGDKVLLAELSLRGGFHRIPEVLLYVRLPEELTNERPSQSKMVEPGRNPRFYFPEVNLILGYLRAVRTAPLNPGQRVACGVIVLRKILERDNLAKLVVPGPSNYLGLGAKRVLRRTGS
jgi:glycosyltransferase involved in cell wall biosynthesis